MLHDLITSFLVAFAAITPSQFLKKIWEVPLDEMDEGDVRHTAASVKVSDAAIIRLAIAGVVIALIGYIMVHL